MVSVSTRFFEIARNATNKISSILEAPVFVTDDRGIVITRSELFEPELTPNWKDNNILANFLRLPICYQTEIGEILVGEPLNQEFVSPRIAQVLVELVINQITNQQEQKISQHELKNQLIRSLVQGQIKHEEIALRQARQLGVDLVPPRAVILINAAGYVFNSPDASEVSAIEQERRIKHIIRSIVSFFHLPNDTICADLGRGEVCVLKASDTKNLGLWAECSNDPKGVGSSWANLVALRRAADALLVRLRNETNAAIDIGIGRYHPGISGLARSYEDAQAALSLGSRFKGHNQVHCLGELGVAAFVGVADETTKVDLAKYLLSPLDHETELVTTLDVFFAEDCCPSSTAKRLSIHRNTLSYRLDKIFSLTGLEPRKFDDAVQMRLCLLLRSLQSPQPVT